MASTKAILDCIGVPAGNRSVLGHLFGFLRRRVPTDPDTTVTAQVSLLQHIRDLKAQHIHLNVIRVGFDAIGAGQLDEAQQKDLANEKVDYAIYKLRNIYQQVDLGVGRVEHYAIATADANGRDDLGSEDEATQLCDEWTVHNSGLDVFVVRNISDSDYVGRSPVGGSCEKDAKDDGMVGGEIGRDFDPVARTFAHEMGHFLGLSHNHGEDNCPDTTAGKDNLMCQTKCANNVRTSVVLDLNQRGVMLDHCLVHPGCGA